MNKEEYIKVAKEKLHNVSSEIMIKQINYYYEAKKYD